MNDRIGFYKKDIDKLKIGKDEMIKVTIFYMSTLMLKQISDGLYLLDTILEFGGGGHARHQIKMTVEEFLDVITDRPLVIEQSITRDKLGDLMMESINEGKETYGFYILNEESVRGQNNTTRG